MTDRQINELIANFMGVDVKYSKVYYRDSTSSLSHYIDHRSKKDGLEFTTSLEWLEEVLIKIRSFTYVKNTIANNSEKEYKFFNYIRRWICF